MFEDFINKNNNDKQPVNKDELIEALKKGLYDRNDLIKQLTDDIHYKNRKIENLEHEVKYLTDL